MRRRFFFNPPDYRAYVGSVSDVFGQAEVGCRVDERTVDLNPEVAVRAGGISRGTGADDQQVGFEFAVNHFMREKVVYIFFEKEVILRR